MKTLIFAFSALAATILWINGSYACGPNSNCELDGRTYRIAMPEGHDGKSRIGAIIFNHGYRGIAAGTMRNSKMRKAISNLGLAFVAPKSARADWDIPNAPSAMGRGELAYFDALKRDLVDKHFVDPDKIVVAGFSAGGMMTWQLACQRSTSFAGFVPIAGTFWKPVPDACPTPLSNIIHVHGTSDKIVPLEGRPIGSTHQGNVYAALKLVENSGAYGKWKSQGEIKGLTCQQRTSKEGEILQLCLHPGGHSVKSNWLSYAWNVFDKAGAFGK